MELREPKLHLEREARADDRKLAEMRAIQFCRQRKLSQAAAESENAESLRRQLAEMDAQITGLKVVALHDRLIISSELGNLIGRFVHKGDELLRVSDPHEKELLVSVREANM